MKTKALLLTAALGVAGVATSMAQVYSVNSVGYINISVPNGFSIVANQLKQADYSLNSILPAPPLGTTVYKLVGGSFVIHAFDPDDQVWLPNGNLTIGPGDGAYIFNPSSTYTWTLVGEVHTGTPLVTPLVNGFSMVSSQVPQQGSVSALGLVGQPGYTIYKLVSGAFEISAFDPDDLVWLPSEPSLNVGEGILFFNPSAPSTWDRNFTL